VGASEEGAAAERAMESASGTDEEEDEIELVLDGAGEAERECFKLQQL
jgi:hypothetical protein